MESNNAHMQAMAVMNDAEPQSQEQLDVMTPVRWYMNAPGTVERMATIWVYDYTGGPTHLYEGTRWCSCENDYTRELNAALERCARHVRNVAKVEMHERMVA